VKRIWENEKRKLKSFSEAGIRDLFPKKEGEDTAWFMRLPQRKEGDGNCGKSERGAVPGPGV